MAGTDKTAKVAVGIGAAAAIAAALALLSRKAQASEQGGGGGPVGPVELPDELWQLIIAIADKSSSIDEGIAAVAVALQNLSINVQGYVPNAERMTATRVQCIAIGTPYQLPDIAVPDDMQLLLLGWPLNPGWIFVGATAAECTNINQSYPLPPGAVVGYRIKNAKTLWVSANAVPCWVVITAEQRSG